MSIDVLVNAIKDRYPIQFWGEFRHDYKVPRSTGRPLEQARIEADLRGEKTYIGRACKKCGGTHRHTNGGGCIECKRKQAVRAQDRAPTFFGMPCMKCGGKERFQSNNRCVACRRAVAARVSK